MAEPADKKQLQGKGSRSEVKNTMEGNHGKALTEHVTETAQPTT